MVRYESRRKGHGACADVHVGGSVSWLPCHLKSPGAYVNPRWPSDNEPHRPKGNDLPQLMESEGE